MYRECSREREERERDIISFFLVHPKAKQRLFLEKEAKLMDFVVVRRRISYRERMAQLLNMLNKSPTREVSIKDLVKKWQLSPNYVRRLMKWATERYDHVTFDENYGVLFLKSDASPVYRFNKAQKTLVEVSK